MDWNGDGDLDIIAGPAARAQELAVGSTGIYSRAPIFQSHELQPLFWIAGPELQGWEMGLNERGIEWPLY